MKIDFDRIWMQRVYLFSESRCSFSHIIFPLKAWNDILPILACTSSRTYYRLRTFLSLGNLNGRFPNSRHLFGKNNSNKKLPIIFLRQKYDFFLCHFLWDEDIRLRERGHNLTAAFLRDIYFSISWAINWDRAFDFCACFRKTVENACSVKSFCSFENYDAFGKLPMAFYCWQFSVFLHVLADNESKVCICVQCTWRIYSDYVCASKKPARSYTQPCA